MTGVGRLAGIGAGIARRLAADGWDLVLTYWQDYDARMPWGVQPDDVERLTAELQATGAAVVALPADFQDPQAVDRLMEDIAAEAGPLQGLVLSHAESVDSGILDTTLESFERHFAVNARASWQLIAAFARQAPAEGGAVVALTSDHTAFNLPYGASKGALDRIVIAAARELGPQGISANVAQPGAGGHRLDGPAAARRPGPAPARRAARNPGGRGRDGRVPALARRPLGVRPAGQGRRRLLRLTRPRTPPSRHFAAVFALNIAANANCVASGRRPAR